MDIRTSVTVHFFGEHQASVTSQNNGEESELSDYLVLCFFAIRQLVSLGVGSVASDATGNSLSQIAASFGEFLAGRYGPELIDSPESGKRQFVATLTHVGGRPDFQLRTRGFGFFALHMDRYARASVIALMRHFALKRRGSTAFLKGLQRVAAGCSALYRAGELGITSQAGPAIALAMAALDDFVGALAPTPTHNEELEARKAGANLTAQDLVATFASLPKHLEVGNLDTATRAVLFSIVHQQSAILWSSQPVPLPQPEDEFLGEVGRAVLDGYIIGRRLWANHLEPIRLSTGETETEANGQRMLLELQAIKPWDILLAAGEHVGGFVFNYGTVWAKEGLYAQLADASAQKLVLVAVLNGFALSIAERRMIAHA